jgi:hypothetical protein
MKAPSIKTPYVTAIRWVRAALGKTGILRLLDRWAARSRTGLWVRSLLAIYDLEDLLTLDVPWWTFESADQVSEFLTSKPQARVFEWGSGASTAWLARRAASVTSVEHDGEWAQIVRSTLPAHANVIVVEPVPAIGAAGEELSAKEGFLGLNFRSYVEAINSTEGEFDLIVVDGRAREGCFRLAVTKLAEGGLLVFDNVDRERYRDAMGTSPIPVDITWTRGLTPALPYPTRTALVRLSD